MSGPATVSPRVITLFNSRLSTRAALLKLFLTSCCDGCGVCNVYLVKLIFGNTC